RSLLSGKGNHEPKKAGFTHGSQSTLPATVSIYSPACPTPVTRMFSPRVSVRPLPGRWCHPLSGADAPGAGIRCAQQRATNGKGHHMTDVFGTGDHEQVVFCHDRPSGLRAIIAIHSTALGPALGGTRFHPYPSENDALVDVMHLATAMSYKNALAGLDHGGGKAVILGDPTRNKTEALLRAYGRFVQSLGGRYITACDVGTYVKDMDIVARESEFVTGRSVSN